MARAASATAKTRTHHLPPVVADGVAMDGELPAKDSVQKLFDDMDLQQATQTYLWALPIVSFAEWQQVHERLFGAHSGDLVVYQSYEDRLGILTANATTPYILAFVNLAQTGPVALEVPPGHISGGVTDFWQRELAVLGEMGADEGKASKYLVVPPGGSVPSADGFGVIQSSTMNIFAGFRLLEGSLEDGMGLVRAMKIYPFAQRDNPPPTRVLSPGGKKWYGGQPSGIAYWERLHAILQSEPIEERDRFFAAWLQNLGIEKGKPFKPDQRKRLILEAAAQLGESMAKANSFAKRIPNIRHWPDRRWEQVITMADPSQRLGDIYQFAERSGWFYEAVGCSKAMMTKTPGVGQAYLSQYSDKDGNWLDGEESHTLHVPANPPAKNFWSITIYDTKTRCLIDNPQRKADLSSRQNLKINSDGSIDLYFGPAAPAGGEQNWIQTIPGRHWFAYFRFYGPTEAYFDTRWKMGDIELTKLLQPRP